MNSWIDMLNQAATVWGSLSWAMLIQSSVLILVLYGLDLWMRKRVRAIVRYGLWMLVLVKLLLPPTLSIPTGIGYWVNTPTPTRKETTQPIVRPSNTAPTVPMAKAARQSVSRPKPIAHTALPTPATTKPATTTEPRRPALSWQTWLGLTWLVGVLIISGLLLRRLAFVKRLIKNSQPAQHQWQDATAACSQLVGLKSPIKVRIAEDLYSPAACGLFRPVILMPRSIEASLSQTQLKAILLHELIHIKRADLWVNLLQTLLQVLYFFHPLLWLANATIRRLREKAVDETVLNKLGQDQANQYSQTLIDIVEIAFTKPSFTLGLIGVVESKKALSDRIKHMLTRPVPRSARIGLIGLAGILIFALALLPMAEGGTFNHWFHKDRLIKFKPSGNPTGDVLRHGDSVRYSKDYTVNIHPKEQLLVMAELYQTGKPMQRLGHQIFSSTGQAEKLHVSLLKEFTNEEKTIAKHQVRVTYANTDWILPNVTVNTPEVYATTHWSFCQGHEIKDAGNAPYTGMDHLLTFAGSLPSNRERGTHIWIPGWNNVTWIFKDVYFIVVNMLPMSQLNSLEVQAPEMAWEEQLPDGSYLPADASKEQRQTVADDYVLDIKRTLMRDRMPLPTLTAHTYYQAGEPIRLYFQSKGPQWKPKLEDIGDGTDTNPALFMIDGAEYESRHGVGPFGGMGSQLDLPGNLYVDSESVLSVGKHTIAYGWKNVDVVDPNAPNQALHFDRLLTDPVEFEVVDELPTDYYRPVYQEGWDDILRQSINTPFTDDWHKIGMAGSLLALKVTTDNLPFNAAFEVYVQAEGSNQEHRAGSLTLLNGPQSLIMDCTYGVDALNWETVGDKRWRVILKPSVDVAKARPPIRTFYGREFITDWLTFDRSPSFEMRYQSHLRNQARQQIPHHGGTLRADKPIDLDHLSTKRLADSPVWPLPEGFELGWSNANGGTLKINPESNVRMLWFPQANASLMSPTQQSIDRLPELAASQLHEIIPPQGERTLIAIRSSEGKIYWVTVRKVNETWADISWWEHTTGAVTTENLVTEIKTQNTNLDSPEPPYENQPTHMKQMTERLGEDFLNRGGPTIFRSFEDVIKVIDIGQGRFIPEALLEIQIGDSSPKIPELDQATQDRIHAAALQWTRFGPTSHYGIQLGLLGR